MKPALMVIARTPVPGRSKTRLSPPLTPEEACEVAWACLLDTVEVVAATSAPRRVLVLDGPVGPWVPAGFEVVEQRGEGLAERLAAAFADVGGPAAIIAMDTPHVSPELLDEALEALDSGADAVFGPAADGGYWLIGLAGGVDPESVFSGVPMSAPHTGAVQRRRLEELGLRVHKLPELRDVDDVDDLVGVANLAPDRRVAAVARRVVGR